MLQFWIGLRMRITITKLPIRQYGSRKIIRLKKNINFESNYVTLLIEGTDVHECKRVQLAIAETGGPHTRVEGQCAIIMVSHD